MSHTASIFPGWKGAKARQVQYWTVKSVGSVHHNGGQLHLPTEDLKPDFQTTQHSIYPVSPMSLPALRV